VANRTLRIILIWAAAVGVAVISPVAAARIGLSIGAVELLMRLRIEIAVSIGVIAAAEILLPDIGIA